jgi:putative transposase
MTKKAKPKKNKTGKYVKNNAAQKTGLNKAILAVGWGQLLTFVTYKANRKGGLVITVPPQYTSQECSQCGFISKENRKTQADFACQTCGYSDNADSNASYNIKKKGVEMIYNKSFTFKEKKKVSTRKTMGKVVALHDGNIHDMPCIIHANGELYLD